MINIYLFCSLQIAHRLAVRLLRTPPACTHTHTHTCRHPVAQSQWNRGAGQLLIAIIWSMVWQTRAGCTHADPCRGCSSVRSLRKTTLCFSVSASCLCVSRACLGKRSSFKKNSASLLKRRFRTIQPLEPSAVRAVRLCGRVLHRVVQHPAETVLFLLSCPDACPEPGLVK